MNPFETAPTSSPTVPGGGDGQVFAYLLLTMTALIVLTILYNVALRKARGYIRTHAERRAEATKALRIFRYAYMGIVVYTVLEVFGPSLGVLGLSLTLLSSILSWGLRDPITNFAAWLMIVSQRPYAVGDRIILGGTTGDVKDVNVTYTVLSQIGGTIGGEETSGKTLLIPNSILFSSTIVNYRLDEPLILDEVAVRITYDSNLDRAEQILLSAAQEVVGADASPPYVRYELIPSCVVGRVRYKVAPPMRMLCWTEISKRVHTAARTASDVRLSHIQYVEYLRPYDDLQPSPPQLPAVGDRAR